MRNRTTTNQPPPEKTMNLSEKIETITGKRDTLARRVLNTSPDSEANISADQIARGITLEELEAVNVPVYRYDTQITIHGLIPGVFGKSKLFVKNGNGSIGVRYAAIDAAKKRILARCSYAANGSAWHANIDSQGLFISRSWVVSDESKRQDAKNACISALRSIDSTMFYGHAGAYSLAYGAGYAVQVFIGAIPAENLWPLADFFFGIKNEETLSNMESEKKAIREAERAARNAQFEEERRKRMESEDAAKKELVDFLASYNGERLAKIERKPCKFRFFSYAKTPDGNFPMKTVEIAKRGPFLCVKTSPALYGDAKFRKITEKDWMKYESAASKGLLFA